MQLHWCFSYDNALFSVSRNADDTLMTYRFMCSYTGIFPLLMPCFVLTGVQFSRDDREDVHDIQLYHLTTFGHDTNSGSSSPVTTPGQSKFIWG